jgi:hypothetical protein
MADLSDSELQYLRMANNRKRSSVLFSLNKVTLGLISKGLLEMDTEDGKLWWFLTPEGREAVDRS